ncbi:unnamed protein product, partial [Didymodactylos carnosus]
MAAHTEGVKRRGKQLRGNASKKQKSSGINDKNENENNGDLKKIFDQILPPQFFKPEAWNLLNHEIGYAYPDLPDITKLLSYSSVNGKSFTCPLCHSTFISREGFIYHVYNKCQNLNLPKTNCYCLFCGRKYTHVNVVRKHIRDEHYDPQPIKKTPKKREKSKRKISNSDDEHYDNDDDYSDEEDDGKRKRLKIASQDQFQYRAHGQFILSIELSNQCKEEFAKMKFVEKCPFCDCAPSNKKEKYSTWEKLDAHWQSTCSMAKQKLSTTTSKTRQSTITPTKRQSIISSGTESEQWKNYRNDLDNGNIPLHPLTLNENAFNIALKLRHQQQSTKIECRIDYLNNENEIKIENVTDDTFIHDYLSQNNAVLLSKDIENSCIKSTISLSSLKSIIHNNFFTLNTGNPVYAIDWLTMPTTNSLSNKQYLAVGGTRSSLVNKHYYNENYTYKNCIQLWEFDLSDIKTCTYPKHYRLV